MISGLRVTIAGRELCERISQRIQVHLDRKNVLDARIQKRDGDAPFDVRVEDGLETLGELEDERARHRLRIAELTLLRDRLTVEEVHLLGVPDLRAADLIGSYGPDDQTQVEVASIDRRLPIDGLKLTIPGHRVRELLDDGIESHRASAARWKREAARTPEEQTEDEPLLPDEMCENEAERHEWRAEVLEFLRDHLDATEVYRLGEADLHFGELLPSTPEGVEQADYEERNRVGFALERLAKHGGRGLIACLGRDPDDV
jgi:hypothetical protein